MLDYDDYGKNYATTTVVSDVYEFELSEFLHPIEYSHLEFLGEWNRYHRLPPSSLSVSHLRPFSSLLRLLLLLVSPSLSHGTRFPAGFSMDVAFDSSLTQVETLFEKLKAIDPSFHQVLQWVYSEQCFQLAYLLLMGRGRGERGRKRGRGRKTRQSYEKLDIARYSSMTWFEDQLCFTVIGQQPPSSERIFARFGFRASDPVVLSIFHGQIERWLNEWVGVGSFSIVTDVGKEKNVSFSFALLSLLLPLLRPLSSYLALPLSLLQDILCYIWRR